MSSLSKIALLCIGLLTSCGQRTVSQPSRLTEEELTRLDAAFERLDRVLESNAPNIHKQLHPGSTEEDLDRLRICLSGNQVECLEKWFSWHNGSSEEILPAGLPISVARSVEDQRISETLPFVPPVRQNSVKILDNSAGDGFFMDVNSETPLVFHHMLEDPENPIWFGTLPEFIDFIATGFESGILFEDEEGNFDFDEAKYEELMTKHLQRATGWN
ncbi:MAG: hypothetical protein P1U89_10220 [Verrucomicrobiales bacterium]|nr:hypothetical protein [Verrucomicrobiales bacterium]